MKSIQIMLALLSSAALLAACGGGGGGFEAPPAAPAGNVVPPSATASVANFVAYVDTLRPSDTAEALEVGNLMPPTTDTDEPLAPT